MAGFLQENFPETEAKTQLDNLRLLQGMGVEVSCLAPADVAFRLDSRCTILLTGTAQQSHNQLSVKPKDVSAVAVPCVNLPLPLSLCC